MTEQNGDLALLSRALTYLTLIYRKRSDFERTREFATYSLDVAKDSKMPQYTGSAHAHFAWLAWRAGDLAETKQQADDAIEDWGSLGHDQSAVPFRWYVLFPLLGVALQEEDLKTAVQYAQHMVAPSQQRLPNELTTLLERAVAAGETGQLDAASDLLHQALRLAQELRYI